MRRVNLFLIFGCIVFCFFSNNIFAQNSFKASDIFSISKENVGTLIFENPKTVKEQIGMDFSFTTEADFISGSEFNKLVNVRVYLNLNNQKRLISSDNVHIKNFGKATISNSGMTCSGFLADGNFVIEDEKRDKDLYCLYEVLNKNSFIYDHYKVSLHKFFQ